MESSVYRLEDLGVGSRLDGPAVVEAPDSTIVIPPAGARSWIDWARS
ncbi:hypothetical protein [Aeropyrum camini]|nr:hypothetical protein [Aeropyrum camini]